MGRWGSAGKYLRPSCCIRDSFNLICNITLFWKVSFFTFRPLGSGVGVCGQNICYHYGNGSVWNLFFTGLLSADRSFPYIPDNECIITSIGLFKPIALIYLLKYQEQFAATLIHRLCTFLLYFPIFVIINTHQSVQIPVNAFHIRRLVTWGSSYPRRCRELAWYCSNVQCQYKQEKL